MRVSIPFLAAALLAGVGSVGIIPAFAQTTPPAAAGAAQPDIHHQARQRMLPGQRVDGKIAFLKAELKITPAQEAQWAPVAAAMRDNAQALDRAITTARQQQRPMDAVQRIALRADFAKVRDDNEARFLAAFKPLYASLSPDQQQAANALFTPHHHWHRHAYRGLRRPPGRPDGRRAVSKG
jgi:protein CpxP